MRLETHCHSCYSRGKKIATEGIPRPAEIVKRAKDLGLSGVAITDHRNTKAWEEASREARKFGMLFIPAVELETLEGHLIALGITEPVRNDLPLEETVDLIHDVSGIAVAPHPFDLRGDGIRDSALKTDAVEVFNALNLDRASNRYASGRFRSENIPKVAGSDAHTLETVGRCVNVVRADDNVDSVTRAIKRGRVRYESGYMTMGEIVEWARKRLTGSEDDVREYIRENYHFPRRWLYGKMLKKFLVTSNTPWNTLGMLSLGTTVMYAFLKTSASYL